MNCHERRKREKLLRLGNRPLRLRCAGCDRTGQRMTNEHFFPAWLIEYAHVRRDGITWPQKVGLEWIEKSNVNPEKAVVPLCKQCNNVFGNELESPAAVIFRALEREESISDNDAELLVRWLWKFEGLQWSIFRDHNTEKYSRIYTLRERVATSRAFNEIRPELVVAIALARTNDEGYDDWPLGLDTPVGENAITMSGVFRRVALIVSFKRFADAIHPAFGKYAFGHPPADRNAKIFCPPCSFTTARAVVTATQESSMALAVLHDALGHEMKEQYAEADKAGQLPHLILPNRKWIELPPV